jgi:hypothetical protein
MSMRKAINDKWLPTLGGKYVISESGLLAKQPDTKPLYAQVRKNGYLVSFPMIAKKRLVVSLHRLVALAFVQKEAGKDFVNHIDGNKRNNSAANLEWCTKSENAIHAWANGLNTAEFHSRGEGHYRAKVTEEQVRAIRSGSHYTYGLSKSALRHIRARRSWRHVNA